MNKPRNWRIHSKLLLLIVISALLSASLFSDSGSQQNNVCTLLERAGFIDWFDSEAFTEKARAWRRITRCRPTTSLTKA